jgi:Trypsin-like peptidase domain
VTPSAAGPDAQVPGYLGRVLDSEGQPTGTCFQVEPGVLVTAWHVLDEIAAARPGVRVRVDPLAGGEAFGATVVRADPLHDLAVLSCEADCLAMAAGPLEATNRVRLRTAVTVTGHVVVDDPGRRYRFLTALGEWAGWTTRDDGVALGCVTANRVLQGMSGAPVIRDSDGMVAGVVSGRYNSADGWLVGNVWVARTEDLAVLRSGLTEVRLAPAPVGAMVRTSSAKENRRRSERDEPGPTPEQVADKIVLYRQAGDQTSTDNVDLLLQNHSHENRPAFKTNLYKALKDKALKDEKLDKDADRLLKLSLQVMTENFTAGNSVEYAAEINALVRAALGHPRPSELIVRSWADESLQEDPNRVAIVAGLSGHESASVNSLAEFVGLRSDWDAAALVGLCEDLVDRNYDAFITVRSAIAARNNHNELAHIISHWSATPRFSERLTELLAAIVESGGPEGNRTGAPRRIDFLAKLEKSLGHNRRERDLLRIAAAEHVEGRKGGEIAELLCRMNGQRKLWRAAKKVNKRLVARLCDDGAFADEFIAYVLRLQEKERASDLVCWAMRAFSDPSLEDWEQVALAAGDIVARLHAKAQESAVLAAQDEPRKLEEAAYELLERFLGNEQKMTTEAAIAIVIRVAEVNPQMRKDPRWEVLWGSAVGGWADDDHREEVIKRFRPDPNKDALGGPEESTDYFGVERKAIISSVQ